MEYQDITNGALILYYGGTSPAQVTVSGLKGLTPYTLKRSVQEIKELRSDASRKKTGGVSLGSMLYNGNFVVGDPGQDALKALMLANTSFQHARLYLDDNNFIACDLANDPDVNGWQVADHSPGGADVDNPVLPFNGEIVLNGLPATFSVHYTASMAITKGTGTTEDTITDAADGLVAAGFVPGMTIICEGDGCGANDLLQFLIKTAADGVLTLESIGYTTAITPDASFTVHGGRL